MAIVSRQIALNVAQGTFNGTYTSTNHVRLTDNRMVILYNITGVSPDLYTRTFLVVDMPDGLDTNIASPTITRTVGYLDREAFQGNGASVVRLSDTRFVVSEPRSTGTIKLEVFEISGTTITRVLNTSVQTNTNAKNNGYNASHVLIPLSDTRFIQTYYNTSNQSTYAVYQFNPASAGPPVVTASVTLVRQSVDSETDLTTDISWQRIPGTTDTMIVNRSVTVNYYAYSTRIWLMDNTGVPLRSRFTVDGEPMFLGPNRMVVSKWGRQTYYNKDGTVESWSASQNYSGSNDDNTLYRPIIVPLGNDHHLQLRREYFQELDTSMFMKAVRREDKNFHTVSTWSANNWWGKVVPSSTAATKFTLPFDKRRPVVTSKNNLMWAGLSSGTYRLNMLEPTSVAPVNPPATDPLPQPTRVLNARFLFNDTTKLPANMTVTGSGFRLLDYVDTALGSTGVLATPAHGNNVSYSTSFTFKVPAGMSVAIIRFLAQSENTYDPYNLSLGGSTVASGTGSFSNDFVERQVSVSGTSINMSMSYSTDGSVQGGIGGIYVSMVEFRPV